MLGWNPYLHNPKLRGRLGRISAPALVVRGRHDGIVPRAHAEAYVAGIPDARLVDLESAAHMATLERPGDIADPVVRRMKRTALVPFWSYGAACREGCERGPRREARSTTPEAATGFAAHPDGADRIFDRRGGTPTKETPPRR